MTTIAELSPAIEVYSIEECFVDVSGLNDLTQLGNAWRGTIKQRTGITCGIGFAPTKTLAKLANYAAKKYPATKGVVDLSDKTRQRKLMSITPVDEIWGIGRKLSQRLNGLGIKTALDLADSEPKKMRKQFSVVIESIIHELNGMNCLSLEQVRATKQQIISSRSFGQVITDKEQLKQAIALHSQIAALSQYTE